MINALAPTLLNAWGHLYRDGYPATHSTHLARAIGGFIAICASVLALGLPGVAVGAAVWASFYLDQKHGEAQADAGWLDLRGWLLRLLSGTTSVALPAATAATFAFFHQAPLAVALGLSVAGLLKTVIWPAWWSIRPDRLWAFLEPCRVSAITFGGVIGLAQSAPALAALVQSILK
jgi:hypothetical protein